MEKLLKHINDQENLQLWNDRKNWSDDDDSNKVYVEEDCPSFKEMTDKEVFQDMEKIAKQLQVEYPLFSHLPFFYFFYSQNNSNVLENTPESFDDFEPPNTEEDTPSTNKAHHKKSKWLFQ